MGCKKIFDWLSGKSHLSYQVWSSTSVWSTGFFCCTCSVWATISVIACSMFLFVCFPELDAFFALTNIPFEARLSLNDHGDLSYVNGLYMFTESMPRHRMPWQTSLSTFWDPVHLCWISHLGLLLLRETHCHSVADSLRYLCHILQRRWLPGLYWVHAHPMDTLVQVKI